MKRHIPFLVLVAALLTCATYLGVPAAEKIGRSYRDPLLQLEDRTRELPAMATLYIAPLDDNFAPQTLRLETVVEFVMGVQVNYVDIEEPGLFGFTQLKPNVHEVNVLKTLHQTARLEILSHEAAHRLQPPTISTDSDSEVFAESVSFLVCRVAGHDDLERASVYLAVHKGGLHVLRDYRQDIDYAVMVLTGGMPK